MLRVLMELNDTYASGWSVPLLSLSELKHASSFHPQQLTLMDPLQDPYYQSAVNGYLTKLTELVKSRYGSRLLLLFDIDGTLLSSHDVSIAAFFDCLSSVMGRTITLSDTTPPISLGGRTDLDLVYELAQRFHIPEREHEEFAIKFLQRHPAFLQKWADDLAASAATGDPAAHRKALDGQQSISTSKVPASSPTSDAPITTPTTTVGVSTPSSSPSLTPIKRLPGVLELLTSLQTVSGDGIISGLLTGNSEAGARIKLLSCNIQPSLLRFDCSAFGDITRDRNSLPLYAWTRLKAPMITSSLGPRGGVTPQGTIIIGDTPKDIECALKNGTRILAVATGTFSVAQLRAAGATHVVDSLHPLTVLPVLIKMLS
jgi:phosphoglycolate phosphatase-like HAD superfamily hydrolase